MTGSTPALLALEDGTTWPGLGFGARADAAGEIVFNTSLAGYQEILTDPSYHGQLVTLTCPHVGNTGINAQDDESGRVWAAALVVRDLSPVVSSWRATGRLDDWLRGHGRPAITGVETRALVRHIREQGAMRAALSTADPDPARLVALARATRDMSGLDLAREVTCAEPYAWNDSGYHHVVAYDFGIKRSILRQLAVRGCRVTVVPADTTAAEALAMRPDGIFLSNGPGDPAAVTAAIAAVRELLGRVPIFGICLGHQILALALGARTYKLKFGHRGGNQPVRAPAGGRVEISAHNHGFAVDPATLPEGAAVTLVNLSDGCCEGLAAPALRAFAVQYHPESAPGPRDSLRHFDEFVALMAAARGEATHAQA